MTGSLRSRRQKLLSPASVWPGSFLPFSNSPVFAKQTAVTIVLCYVIMILGMKPPAATFCLTLASAALAACCAGCDAPKIKPVLTDPDPSVKIPAIELAVKQHDCSAIPILVQNLESDDPAIRFYSNDALRKLTGLDFGYLYYADEEIRRPAVEKWRNWLASPAGKTAIATRQL